jgi:hypothetical protein
VAIWYIFPRFGLLRREKSGNPDPMNIASAKDVCPGDDEIISGADVIIFKIFSPKILRKIWRF